MTYSRAVALAVAALCMTSPLAAKDKKPVDPNKRICRSDVPTGSRMSKSVCHTAAEWAQIDADNAATAQTMQDRTQRTQQ
jgi:hypothetical protein